MLGLIVGIIGLVLLLVAFVFEEFTSLAQDSMFFNLLNIVGSIGLGYYALILGSIPFIILEVVWGAVALWKLVLILEKRKQS